MSITKSNTLGGKFGRVYAVCIGNVGISYACINYDEAIFYVVLLYPPQILWKRFRGAIVSSKVLMHA